MRELSCEEVRQAVHGRWITPAGSGATVRRAVTDSRAAREGDLFFALRGERMDGHEYVASAVENGASAAVVRKDFRLPPEKQPPAGGLLGVEDTVAALGALGAWHRSVCPAKVVAVTGSNGKTTVKRMIHHILSRRLSGSCSPKSYNNAIGVPLTLLGVAPGDDYVVCEVGTNAPGEVAALGRLCRPNIAVITSVSPTHLERLRSVEGVAAEKASLLGELVADGIAVACGGPGAGAAAGALEKALRAYGHTVIRFGEGEECEVRLTAYRGGPASCEFQVNGRLDVSLPVPGRHNALNALAAMTVAQRFGFSLEQAGAALVDFAGADMRLQAIEAGPVTILNDAYNANPASMAAAAEVLAEQPATRRVFVAGDMLELGEQAQSLHVQTGRDIAARLRSPQAARLDSRQAAESPDWLIGVGPLGRYIAEGAAQAGMRAEAMESVEQAMALLPARLLPGDVVLVKGSRGLAMERLIEPIKAVRR